MRLERVRYTNSDQFGCQVGDGRADVQRELGRVLIMRDFLLAG